MDELTNGPIRAIALARWEAEVRDELAPTGTEPGAADSQEQQR